MAGTRTVVVDLRDFPPNFEREDIAKRFYEQYGEDHPIDAIQIVPGGVCKVTFKSRESKISLCGQETLAFGGVDCRVLNYAKRITKVQIHYYPVEADLDPLGNVLAQYGVIKKHRFQHWADMTEISTGTRLFDMVLNRDIPRTLKVGQSRVKVWYRDQPLQCDICSGNHKVSECDLRGKCRRCRQEGHFSRNCPVPWGRTDDAVPRVSPESDPTPAEAAGRAGVSTRAAQPPRTPLIDESDSLDDAIVDSASLLRDPASRDSPESESAPLTTVTDGDDDSADLRDNQLDECASQSLLSTPTPSCMESDSLDGATVDTAGPSPNSPNSGPQISGDGEGTACNTTSNLNNVSSVGTTNANGTGLLSKIKSKVGLNKNKEKKAIKQKQTSNNGNEKQISINNGNEKQISISNGNNVSISNDKNLSCDGDITQDSSCDGMEEGEVVDYIGEGIHAGKSVDEVDLADGSQKRPLSDSSDDTVNSADFAVPVGPAPRPSRKKPAVVVSMGQSRSVAIGDERSRSRSPVGRSPSAGRSPQPAMHQLPSSVASVPKPKRGPESKRSSKKN